MLFCQLDVSSASLTCHCNKFVSTLTWHFANLPFNSLPFHKLTTLPKCYFINLLFELLNMSSTSDLKNISFCQITISSICHFVKLPFHQFAIVHILVNQLSSYQLGIFVNCHFTNAPFQHSVIL